MFQESEGEEIAVRWYFCKCGWKAPYDKVPFGPPHKRIEDRRKYCPMCMNTYLTSKMITNPNYKPTIRKPEPESQPSPAPNPEPKIEKELELPNSPEKPGIYKFLMKEDK